MNPQNIQLSYWKSRLAQGKSVYAQVGNTKHRVIRIGTKYIYTFHSKVPLDKVSELS